MNNRSKIKTKYRNPYKGIHPYKRMTQLNNTAYRSWRDSAERCVICGNKCKTTQEHLPPQSIYVKTPTEVVTVRSCDDCQKSPDREFADFLAAYCVQNGATKSSRELLSYRKKQFQRKGVSLKYMQHVSNSNLHKISLLSQRFKPNAV